MSDIFLERLANVITNYSLDVQEGNEVVIIGDSMTEPLMLEMYKEMLKVGAHPALLPIFGHAKEVFFKYASEEQITHTSYIIKNIYEKTDRIANIRSSINTKQLTNVDPGKIALEQKSLTDIIKIMFERESKGNIKWNITAYPTDSMAQEASMSLFDYRDFVFKAGHLDKDDPVAEWKRISKMQQKYCDWLQRREEFRFVGEDTDLTLSCKGRKWINCDGTKNFPDGEVFTGPVEDSVNGKIRFTYPLIYLGNEIEDIVLEFKDGQVESFSARKGQGLLEKIIGLDEGSNKVGEIAIGTNYNITRFTKNILFDEKIGGTMHMALGRSIPESGGKNMSSIHLDILKDMKVGGMVFADDEMFYKDGKFLI
ncbi:MAG: aminopeptidase [Candidatus Methanofastidiosa archaeon]|nr:aminopeptidase [Candidatus Methanofastidiosa archaeon]